MAPQTRKTLRQWELLRERLESRTVRRDFRTYLNEIITGDSDADASEMILGELLANAIEHGAGHIRASICCDRDALYVAVADDGAGFPMPDRAQMDSTEQERGRGLAIVRSLSNDVRIEHEKGTRVEARLPVRMRKSQKLSA